MNMILDIRVVIYNVVKYNPETASTHNLLRSSRFEGV